MDKYTGNGYKQILEDAADHDDFGRTKPRLDSLNRRLDDLSTAVLAAVAVMPESTERDNLARALRAIRNGVGP